MILKKLHIQNFRCFKDYEIDFAPGVTVLFGKNGSGKSTLINALHKALSFTMHSVIIKDKTSKSKRPKVVEVQDITDGNPYVCVEGFSKFGDENYKGVKPAEYTIDVHAEAELSNGQSIDWSISAYAKNGGKRPSEYKRAFSDLYSNFKQTGKRPLLAYYSDVYPFMTVKKAVSKHEKGKFSYLQTSTAPGMAYTDWNDDNGITNKWIERLETKLRNRVQFVARDIVDNNNGVTLSDEQKANNDREAAEVEHEINAITNCLRMFSSNEIGGMPLQVKELNFTKHDFAHLHVYLTEGEPIPFRKLPAGYLRLYSIVLDLAYRSFILSRGRSTDIPGIVIIDEIDLHLHPELEQSVLQRLMKTFPSVQFIISTHSPLVLSGLETKSGANAVLQMQPNTNSPQVLQNVYGIDYNQVLEENMQVQKRHPELQVLFDRLWEFVGNHDTVNAKAVLKEIEQTSTPADQIELVKLRALIGRIEMIGR